MPSDPETGYSEIQGLNALLDFLEYLLGLLIGALLFDAGGAFDLGHAYGLVEAVGKIQIACGALGLLEAEHVLQAALVQAVVAVPQHHALAAVLKPQIAKGTLRGRLQGFVPRALIMQGLLLEGEGQEFG